MSNSKGKVSYDGYSILPGMPCRPGGYGVQKRAHFVSSHLGNGASLILDIGCGIGAYLETLCNCGSQVIGIDINRDYLMAAKARVRRRDKVTLALMSAEKLAFRDDFFDAVTCIETLEHIPHDLDAIREISRVLKSSGRLILTAPNRFFPFETHGIKIGPIRMRFPFSLVMPFLTYLPKRLRKLCSSTRVYSQSYLTEILTANGFRLRKVDVLMPAMDAPEERCGLFPQKAYRFVRRVFNLLEKSPLKRFAVTIIVCAEKV